jgi:hypothetical protein
LYIKELDIRQLRCFRQTSITFAVDENVAEDLLRPKVTLLVGNNGAGKTTVLQAIALAILAPILGHSGFVPYHLVRRIGARKGGARATIGAQLLLHPEDHARSPSAKRSLRARVAAEVRRKGDVETVGTLRTGLPWSRALFDDLSPAFFLLAYGATRRVESSDTYDSSLRGKSRLLRYQRVAGLFEEQVTLVPLQAWLPKFQSMNPGRYKQFTALINRLLPPDCEFTERLERNEFLYRFRGTLVPFGALSDGYRAYVGWINDLLFRIAFAVPNGIKLADIRGVVLVDEVDLHLHPEWQRVAIPTLADALPAMQFIFTTHSPIVAGTLQAANIALLENAADGASSIERSNERIHGLNAAQILSGRYFGLRTSRAPDVVDDLEQLSKRVRQGEYGAALTFLHKLTAAKDEPTEGGALRAERRPKRVQRRKVAKKK